MESKPQHPQEPQPQIGSDSASQWGQCLLDFLQDLYDRSHSAKSIKLYRHMLVHFFTLNKPPDAYTRADVEAFIHRPCASPNNRGGPPSTATRNMRLAVISSFYKYAATYTIPGPDGQPHVLLKKPSPTLGIRYGKVAQHPHAFSAEELRRFFAAIPRDTILGKRDFALFSVYFFTSRRREEIARLRWGDIEVAMFIEDGKARQGWRFRFFGKGKSEQAQYQELPHTAKDAIDAYLLASGRMGTMHADSPVFLAIGPPQGGGMPKRPDMPLHSSAIEKAFKNYLSKAGLDPKKFSLHSLRHTSAQQRWQLKPDILALQTVLDHAKLDTTRLYLEGLQGTSDPVAQHLEAQFASL